MNEATIFVYRFLCVCIPFWRRASQPTPLFTPGESPGQRDLAGYSPHGCKESDVTEAA